MNYYNEINRQVKNCSINKNDLNTYYNVGKLLLDVDNQCGKVLLMIIY